MTNTDATIAAKIAGAQALHGPERNVPVCSAAYRVAGNSRWIVVSRPGDLARTKFAKKAADFLTSITRAQLCRFWTLEGRTNHKTPILSQATTQRVVESYRKLPGVFEANCGQSEGQVQFLAGKNGQTVFLTASGIVLSNGCI